MAVSRFLAWCEKKGLALRQLQPMLVAAYIEGLQKEVAPPTVKQHLAAIRMLFDYLVVGQVLPFNPASAVRGPTYVVKVGKTPVLTPEEARSLLDSIDTSHVVGLRDRALIAVMTYPFARVGAVVGMKSGTITAKAGRPISISTKKGVSSARSPLTTGLWSMWTPTSRPRALPMRNEALFFGPRTRRLIPSPGKL